MATKIKNFALILIGTLSWALMIFMNYAAGTGYLFENSVGQVSYSYPTLITPAGFTFSIWGVIYIFWTLFLIQLWRKSIQRTSERITHAAIAFIIINLSNTFWIITWTEEFLLLSVILIILLLVALVKLSIIVKAEIVPIKWTDLVFVHWTVSIYLGWVILATVLNISIYLESIQAFANIPNKEWIAMALLLISAIIYVLLIIKRNMREMGLVGIWGLSGIAQAQLASYPIVAYTAIAMGVVLVITVVKNIKSS